jgi:hypothetical protein
MKYFFKPKIMLGYKPAYLLSGAFKELKPPHRFLSHTFGIGI